MRLNLQANTKLPSNRSFGFLFAAILASLSAYGVYRGWSTSASIAWAIAAIALLAVTLLYPVALSPFNRAWCLLGMLLGKVVGPIVLGVIFYVLIAPVAMIGRLLGRDELCLTLMSSIRRFLVDASVVLASVVVTFLALNLAFNIAMSYSIKQGVIFPRALLNLIGRHYPHVLSRYERRKI